MSAKKVIKKKHVVNVRLNEDEKNYIKEQAEAAGITLSRFMRETALNTLIRTKADSAVLRELRRLGGLCKHAISTTNSKEDIVTCFNALTKYASSLIK